MVPRCAARRLPIPALSLSVRFSGHARSCFDRGRSPEGEEEADAKRVDDEEVVAEYRGLRDLGCNGKIVEV